MFAGSVGMGARGKQTLSEVTCRQHLALHEGDVSEGGARNSKAPTLFQVADIDSGVVRWVNADLVTHIVPKD